MKENMALFEELLHEHPKFHVSASGEPISWAVSPDVLRYLFDSASENTRSVETGCGLSTVVLCIQGGDHTAVTPFPDEVGRVEAYCRAKNIPTSRVRFRTGRSEEVLPTLPRSPLDLVLIDGRHAFPSPFVDWYYVADRLVPGGLMIVDDTQLKTGAILAQFMELDPHWELARKLPTTAVFTKVKSGIHEGEWTDQPWMSCQP